MTKYTHQHLLLQTAWQTRSKAPAHESPVSLQDKQIICPVITMAQKHRVMVKHSEQSRLCGIYRIRNKKTGEFYVGKSVNIYSRWNSHQKYGNFAKDTHDFEILILCPEENLNFFEKAFISGFDCILPYGMNKKQNIDSSIQEVKEKVKSSPLPRPKLPKLKKDIQVVKLRQEQKLKLRNEKLQKKLKVEKEREEKEERDNKYYGTL